MSRDPTPQNSRATTQSNHRSEEDLRAQDRVELEVDIPLLTSLSIDTLSDEERNNLAIQSLHLAEEVFSPLSEELVQIRWKAAIIFCELRAFDKSLEVAEKALAQIDQRLSLNCSERPDIDLMIRFSLQEVIGQALLLKGEPARAFALWLEVVQAFESTASSVIKQLKLIDAVACTETLSAATVHLEEIQRSTLAQHAPEVCDQKRSLLREIENASHSFITLINSGTSLAIKELLQEKGNNISPHILVPVLGILARGIDPTDELIKKQNLLIVRWELAVPFFASTDSSLHERAGFAGLELLELYLEQKKGTLACEVILQLLPQLAKIGPYIAKRIEDCAYRLLAIADFDDAREIEQALRSAEVTYACVNGKLANLVQAADLYCSGAELEVANSRIIEARRFLDEMGESYFERECLAYFYKTAWLIASERGDEPTTDSQTDGQSEQIEYLLRQMMKCTKIEGKDFLHRGIIRAEAATNLAALHLKRGEVNETKKYLSEAWSSLRTDFAQEPALNFLIASECVGILSDLPSYTPKDNLRRDLKILKFLAYAMSPEIVMSGEVKLQQALDLAHHALSLCRSLLEENDCSLRQSKNLNLSMAEISRTIVTLVQKKRMRTIRLLKIAKEFQEYRVAFLEESGASSVSKMTSARSLLSKIERNIQRKEGFT